MTLSKLTIACGTTVAVSMGAFIWEYIARKSKSTIKPSTALSFVGSQADLLFTTVGKLVAKLSSFYTKIDLSEVLATFNDLFDPMCQIVVAPLKVVKGYWDQAGTYKYRMAVLLGTLTLAAAIMLVGRKYYGSRFILGNMWAKMCYWRKPLPTSSVVLPELVITTE